MTQGEGENLQNGQLPTTPRSNVKYSPAKMIEALKASRGMIATAAQLLGCSRQTIYDAVARHSEINAVVAGERELMLDSAEMKLMEAVEAGESWAVKFMLVTQGQSRGYIERPRGQDEDNEIRVIIEPPRPPDALRSRRDISATPLLPERTE